MADLAFSPSLASAVAELITAGSPISHDMLTRLFAAAKLDAGDPGAVSGIGKVKRARSVFDYARENATARGLELIRSLVADLGAYGCFRSESAYYVGDDACARLRAALRQQGWDVGDDGALRPFLLDGLSGAALNAALDQIVQRARTGATDAALVTGSGKDLLEAVARQVLLERSGSNPATTSFPFVLHNAFDLLGLATPPQSAVEDLRKALGSDARSAFVQALFIVGWVINDLRNAEGTGHGRPFPPTVTDAEAKAAIQIMAAIAEYLRAQP